MDAQSGTGLLLLGIGADTNVFTSIASSILTRPRAVHTPGAGDVSGSLPAPLSAALLELACGCRSNTDRSVPVFGPDRRYGSSNPDSQDSPSISIPTLGTIDASNPAIHAIATSKSSARWNRCRFRSSHTCSLNKASRTSCGWIARQPLRPSPGRLPDLLLDLSGSPAARL